MHICIDQNKCLCGRIDELILEASKHLIRNFYSNVCTLILKGSENFKLPVCYQGLEFTNNTDDDCDDIMTVDIVKILCSRAGLSS